VERSLGVDAGPYRLALPLSSVRQILDVGAGDAPLDPRSLGVEPIALATLLGATPTSTRPAVLLFDGTADPVVLTCCGLRGVIDAPPPRPLPRTVACRWPGLLRGTIVHQGELTLAVDARVLMGLVEGEATHVRERG
jgi:hypothetical protein